MDLTIAELDGNPGEQTRLIGELNARRRASGPQHLYFPSTGGNHGASKAEFMGVDGDRAATTELLNASSAARRAAEGREPR